MTEIDTWGGKFQRTVQGMKNYWTATMNNTTQNLLVGSMSLHLLIQMNSEGLKKLRITPKEEVLTSQMKITNTTRTYLCDKETHLMKKNKLFEFHSRPYLEPRSINHD
mmetsp:Transcript_30810/g.75130  ORF Transcript_30810/g.75130 Transcript_30810/m.75130 type:complete len:108 (+) Transcript_30810:1529-1852(+)